MEVEEGEEEEEEEGCTTQRLVHHLRSRLTHRQVTSRTIFCLQLMHKIKIKKYWSNEMGAFAVLVGTLHYMGLYGQLSASTRPDVENRLSGNGRLDLRPRRLFGLETTEPE
ncbi:unnamed protein product [Merluccius merluccius]